MKRLLRIISWLIFIGGAIALIIRYAAEIVKALEPILQKVTAPALNQALAGTDLDELRNRLDASGMRLSSRLMQLHPSKSNYKWMSHIIGIERWGHSRLKVALGEPLFASEEYDSYRPQPGASWNELQDQWEAARAETIALLDRIRAEGDQHIEIWHNSLGKLTPKMWFAYLLWHADGTSMFLQD